MAAALPQDLGPVDPCRTDKPGRRRLALAVGIEAVGLEAPGQGGQPRIPHRALEPVGSGGQDARQPAERKGLLRRGSGQHAAHRPIGGRNGKLASRLGREALCRGPGGGAAVQSRLELRPLRRRDHGHGNAAASRAGGQEEGFGVLHESLQLIVPFLNVD